MGSARPPSTRAFQPFGGPDDADRLISLLGDGREFARSLCGEFRRIDLRVDQRAVVLLAEHRAGADGQALWIVRDLRGDVARITRRSEVWDARFQDGLHRRRGLRQRHAMRFRLVGRHDRGTARDRHHRHAARLGRWCFRQEGGCLHQRFEILHHHRAGALESGEIGSGLAGERTGMRHRRRRTCLPGAELVDDQRLVGAVRYLGGLDEAQRFGHAFEDAGDGAAARVIREEGDAIRDVHIRRIAGGQQVADGNAAHHRLREREAQRARLADQAQRMWQRRFHRRRDHEGHAGPGAEIQHADAVRAHDAHARFAPESRETLLCRDVRLAPGLRKAGGIDHDAAHTCLRAVGRDLLDRVLARDDDAAIDLLGDRATEGKQARSPIFS